jgi:hypothetical protein
VTPKLQDVNPVAFVPKLLEVSVRNLAGWRIGGVENLEGVRRAVMLVNKGDSKSFTRARDSSHAQITQFGQEFGDEAGGNVVRLSTA